MKRNQQSRSLRTLTEGHGVRTVYKIVKYWKRGQFEKTLRNFLVISVGLKNVLLPCVKTLGTLGKNLGYSWISW